MILDGKVAADGMLEELTREVSRMRVKPSLAVVMVGNNPASEVYVKNKMKACERVGVKVDLFKMDTTEDVETEELVKRLNEDDRFHGVLVQLPLPKTFDLDAILNTISPLKDVDGFHPENVGLLAIGKPRFVPCTAAGIVKLLEVNNVSLRGKHVTVIGRSNIVGRPVALLALQQDATVTICHTKTQDIIHHTQNSDIIIAAAGVPKMIGFNHINPSSYVVDVGIHKVDGQLCGDCDFDALQGWVKGISPVPGGVGPMTVAMLVANTVKAAKLQS